MIDFVPPRCPNPSCPQFRNPSPGFFQRRGCYRTKCRGVLVPRFRCKICRRGFSYQTFRADYRDRRPEVNAALFQLLISGVGFRQCGRLVDLRLQAVLHKFRKISLQALRLNRNLLRRLPQGATYLLDELETFERSSICPLTVPVLIERESMLVVTTGVASIRRKQKQGSRRQRWLERHERQHGRRPDHGRHCVRQVLQRWKRLLGGKLATLVTDLKSCYRTLCRSLFGSQVVHEQYSSRLPRTVYNPLFRINLTEAMLRDNMGRLRRRSWLHSKRAANLRLHLELFACYRNWMRRRTNFDAVDRTPGVVLGLLDRNLLPSEVLAWRQDWRGLAIHPASERGRELIATVTG